MTDWAIEVIDAAGYGGLAALMLVECLFPPIPSEAILPFAGFVVAEGEMSFALAVLAATLGSLVGNVALYVLARRGGRPLVARHGARLSATPERMERLEAWMARYGAWAVLGARAVPLARTVVSLPAGLARYPAGRFVALTAIGSAAWNAALIGVGWALDDSWRRVEAAVGPASLAIAVLVVAACAAALVMARRRSRRAAQEG